MKRTATGLMAIGLGLIAACSVSNASQKGESAKSSGSGTERSFAATGFDQVTLQGPDNVVVKTGGTFAISASGPSDILDKLDIRVDGGTLKIGRKREGMFGNDGSESVTITVTMPSIKGAALAGSGDMSVDKAEGADFAGSIAGSGDLTIASLIASKVDFSIAGSGNLGATGKAKALNYSIAGSGDIEAAGLESETASISIAGSGGIEARVTQTADISIVGSGGVELTGGAKCNTKTMGSGEVRCAP